MDPKKEQERLLIDKLPEGFVRLRMAPVTNSTDELITVEVNRVFEKMTGRSREDLIGRPLTDIMPGIEKSEFDWIGIFGKVAGGAEGLSFEQFFEPLGRWYDINVFSDQPGSINILFHDISAQKKEIASMGTLLDLTKKLVAMDLDSFEFQEPVDVMKNLSGASFVAINTYNYEYKISVTRAISGISSGIRRAAKILGFEPEGHTWPMDTDRLRTIEGGKLVRFKDIYDTAMGAVNKSTASVIQKVFGFGDIYVIELAYSDRPAFGDIIFFMPKNRSLLNREAIELYAAQVGSLLARIEAEEEAKINRERYRSLITNIPGIGYRCKLDSHWTMIYITPDVERITGYPAEEFVNNQIRSFESIIHPEDRAWVRRHIYAAIEKNKPWSIEYRILHRDGSVRWVYEQARLVEGSPGDVKNIDGFILEITDRKKMENDLNETVNYVSSILESIPDIVLRCDRQGTFLDLVTAVDEKKLFMPPDQFLGHKAEEILPAGLGSLFKDTIEKTLATGQLTAISYELPVPEGNLYFNARFSMLNDNEVIILIEEVTRRKKAEEALNYRLEFEKMVSEVSSRFVSLPPERLNDGVNHALMQTGQFFGADRSYILQFSNNLEIMNATHEWCADGVDSQLDSNQGLALKDFHYLADMLKNRNYIYIPDTSSLPLEAGSEQRFFQERGIKSILCIPIMRDRQLFGCFCLDAVKERISWRDDQVNLLTVITEVITNALIRNANDETIRYLSFHDQLTGLYNRHYFVSEIKRLEGSREYPIAVVSADLDGLKLVNDTMGHESGDSYLKSGAALLKESLRSYDILARVGGDEFVILLPRTDYAAAQKVINRIYQRAEMCRDESTGLPLSISTGVAVSENAEKNLEETYRDADAQMYRDKLVRSSRARNNMIRDMLTLLFKHDRSSSADKEYLQALSVKLGQAAGLDEKQLADLVMLAQIHDLGLITVPEEIRNKKSDLSEDELNYIRQHPVKGYRIAQSSAETAEVAELILRHRENYDGTGYPLGLKGEEIPVECRILAITRAYVDLSVEHSTQQALSEIKKAAGFRFDPALTETFMRVLEDS